jgi:hypothetical protein
VRDAAGDLDRIVVDETSFDFRGLTDADLADLLEDFTDALEAIQESHSVTASPEWGAVECDNGLELCQFLYDTTGPSISPDIKRRLGRHLDKCRSWESSEDVTGPIMIDSSPIEMAWSTNFAMRSAAAGSSMACIGIARSGHTGWRQVTLPDGSIGAAVYFFSAVSDLEQFWRDLYERDNIPEERFFDLGAYAFPDLVLASGLTFRKFDGTYSELRNWVVQALSVINDAFPAALAAGSGQPSVVQAALGHFGLNLSPESPKTRGNPKVMKQRDVTHKGETYRCEWHAKKDPHRNRIHFSVPDQRLEHRILIGIFVDHLDT